MESVKLFGTDGVRGVANRDLTPELALSLARAAAAALVTPGDTVIIGRDTRESGPMLEGALAAGFAAAGADVLLAGVIPTPAISFLIKDEHAALGAVISASHNPPEDNGIKFFDPAGMKLAVSQEEKIEAAISGASSNGDRVGRISPLDAAASRYAAFLIGTIESEDVDLAGTRIVVDCAYGATGAIAPRVLRHFNAEVIELHTAPDGWRINRNCGSTHLESLQAAVREHKADLGIAFDGDGDRVLLVGPDGQVIDGDRMMGIAALHMHRKGDFSPPLVVATVMSNLGLEQRLRQDGIDLVRTPVGDRWVAWEMRARGARLGGEQSGHVIFSDHSPTGDGILTAVKLLEIAHMNRSSLPELAQEIPLVPQLLRNIEVANPKQVTEHPRVIEAIAREQAQLGDAGRILVRPSGTQPIVRVMVEGPDPALCAVVADRLTTEITRVTQSSPNG